MNDFMLDHRLEKDCIFLGTLDNSLVLLMNNRLAPWIILVPKNASAPEIIDFDLLPEQQQILLLKQINQLSKFLRSQFKFDKLNIATIGNIVQQMHIHIVARSKNDYCWPSVVWGADGKEQWTPDQVSQISHQLCEFLPDNFKMSSN